MPTALILTLVVLGQPPSTPAGWTTYAPKPGGFRIALPVKPTEKTVTQKGANGPVDVLEVSCEAEGCLYKVERTTMSKPFGKANEAGALGAIRKSVAARTTIKSEREIEVQGHPGRDFVVEAPLRAGAKPSMIAMRLIVADRDLYQIRVFAIEPGTQPKHATAFLDSFQLTASPAPAP